MELSNFSENIHPQSEIPTLPDETTLVYVAEGAANVVFRMRFPVPTPPVSALDEYFDDEKSFAPSEISPDASSMTSSESREDESNQNPTTFAYKLLRLRKDLPHTRPAPVTYQNFCEYIQPLFRKDDIVSYELVKLPAGFTRKANDYLASMQFDPQSRRPAHRFGVELADDNFGLLMTDMTSLVPSERLIEFKPKWLVQSPSAPTHSKRCRSCAQRARKSAALIAKGQPPLAPFCPLDLISANPADIRRAAITLGIVGTTTHPSPASLASPNLLSAAEERLLARFADWSQSSPLLKQLKNAQKTLDRKGPAFADENDRDFLAAMTLRDVSLFLTVPEEDTGAITARIGDLDLKNPEKGQYWQETEEALSREGWYMGEEEERKRQLLDCHLCPQYWEGV